MYNVVIALLLEALSQSECPTTIAHKEAFGGIVSLCFTADKGGKHTIESPVTVNELRSKYLCSEHVAAMIYLHYSMLRKSAQ